MRKDNSYIYKAMENRGKYTESLCSKKLINIFGNDRVFENIRILNKKGEDIGEIDVLAVFADRAIILQAKSKKLTLEARKGNDKAIQDDFKKAIQHSYDQGLSCAKLLSDKNNTLVTNIGTPLNVRRDFEEIFILCVISDHYPALSFQAKQFLKYEKHKIIKPPFIMDVFFLDVLCEFLQSPLHFLNYLHRRLSYFEKILSSNELAVLSYHLTNNLWIDGNSNMVLADDLAVYVDSAMVVRRNKIPGEFIPKGILTKFKGTAFEKILSQISALEQDKVLELGYLLLELDEETVKSISDASDLLIYKTISDKQLHDFTIMVGNTGLTVHCSYLPKNKIITKLFNHCLISKYREKADKWFGLAIKPTEENLITVFCGFEEPWKKSQEMENALQNLPNGKRYKNLTQAINKTEKDNSIP